ncbi:hypothetical protein [Neolewinella litorea]|uniref:Uncharacterized protein n=1 Tax=Neolewinella litorea TaxID=2562452 RepID=A0A4S4NAF4_9BACT|nr:hypothetical protein [Neolewinella litorea]THH36306.1 hypothetical protein E4021_15460 [Neolewinella litorea]
MKHILTAGLLGLAMFNCSDSTTNPETVDGTEQAPTPGMEVAAEPVEMDDATTMAEEETAFTTHFEMALDAFDQSQFAVAADHMQEGISSLETEAVNLQGDAQQQLKTIIQQLEDLTDGVRAGEVTDRTEIETLSSQAQQVLAAEKQ